MTKRIITIYLTTVLLSCMVTDLWGQDFSDPNILETASLTNKQLRKLRPTYISIGLGNGYSRFRDFATSPLFYEGITMQAYLSRLKKDELREAEMGASFDFGKCDKSYNDSYLESKVYRLDLMYSKLYKIEKLSIAGLNTKGGFKFDCTGDLRYNGKFSNNESGIDIFCNLMGAVKVTKYLGRKIAAENVPSLKQKSKKKNGELSYQLNIGLVNSSYRNGYAYSQQNAFVNDQKNIFDDYQFKLFSGFRIGCNLDYMWYLKNNNAFKVSYVWDAYKTGGDLDKLEMAHHILRFTMLFNTNNR